MKDKISELMDSELDERARAAAIDALHRDGEAVEAWRTYHLISDAMRDTPLLSDGFAARLARRLEDEPTVLAPMRRPSLPRLAWAAAASLAAVALVGWLAFAPQQEPAPQVAQSAQPPRPSVVVRALPKAANDYLLAHQGFSPRVYLQGMAPYVRTVSEPAEEPGR